MTKETKDKLLKIIEHYGVMPQLKYFQSEVFELNEAILANRHDAEGLINDGDIDHIAEEIADVLVMLLQFKEYYEITDEQIKNIMNYKIDRTLERIENENSYGDV